MSGLWVLRAFRVSVPDHPHVRAIASSPERPGFRGDESLIEMAGSRDPENPETP
jgi:hypothetical protein